MHGVPPKRDVQMDDLLTPICGPAAMSLGEKGIEEGVSDLLM